MFVNSLLGGLRNLSRTPELLFHRHGHRDRLNRIVGGVIDLVDPFDPRLKDFSLHAPLRAPFAAMRPDSAEIFEALPEIEWVKSLELGILRRVFRSDASPS